MSTINNIHELKVFIEKELEGIYNKEEINSMFNLLLEYILKKDYSFIHINPQIEILEDETNLFFDYVRQLKHHKPIQYILGRTDFFNIKLKLNSDVLIPRPETEELVDWLIKSTDKNKNLKIIDIGTGSGCIGISLAKNLPNSNVIICDISDKALLTALKNAQLNKVNCQFYLFDILDCDDVPIPQKFDIIISNPPYVREKEKRKMARNVLDYEPSLALFVKDNNPLIFYQNIVKFANKYLEEKGEVYLEINENLAKETENVFLEAGFTFTELKKDINGKYRMLYAKK